MEIKTRVTLFHDGPDEGPQHGFGRGVALLLTGVEQQGSLYAAARELGMAYSKAWRILRQVEEEFDLQLLARHGPRGSVLTDQGRLWLARYQAVQRAAEQAAAAEAAKFA